MSHPRALDAALRLRVSLDAVAGALSSPDEALLVAAESGLAAALGDIGRVRDVDSEDRAVIAAELIQARAALARCRILGAVVADAARATFASQGRGDLYDRAGATPSGLTLRGTAVKARL